MFLVVSLLTEAHLNLEYSVTCHRVWCECSLDCLLGLESWSQTRRLRVFENGVLRIFGPKRVNVTGEWRKLHNKKLNDLCSSSNIVWVIK